MNQRSGAKGSAIDLNTIIGEIEAEAAANSGRLEEIRKGVKRVWAKQPWNIKLKERIASAETNANAGEEVTPMEQFSGLSRKAAVAIGKAVIYLSSFITFKQRNFNNECVVSMKLIARQLERLDRSIQQLTKEVDEIRRANTREIDQADNNSINLRSNKYQV